MSGTRFVSIEKQSKKNQRQHYAARRESWNGVMPVTKVIPNKKRTSRSIEKARLREELG